MSEKEISMEDIEKTLKITEEQIELEHETEAADKAMWQALNTEDMCVMSLLKTVNEVKSDYQRLRRELAEVHNLQRELSSQLRAQLRAVHCKFDYLRQQLHHKHSHTPPHMQIHTHNAKVPFNN